MCIDKLILVKDNTKEFKMTLGEALVIRLEELLKERKISLYKFLKDNCIADSTIRNITSGRTKCPTLAIIYQIAHGFGMTHVEFLNHPIFFSDEIEYL